MLYQLNQLINPLIPIIHMQILHTGPIFIEGLLESLTKD